MVYHALTGVIWAHGVFWVAAAFVIFFVLFGRMIWRALAAMLDARAAAIRLELEEAARLRREAQEMLRDAQARREEALAAAKQLLDSAQTEASRLAAATRDEAEAAAQRRERMAIDRIAAAEKAAVNEVRLAAVEVAAAAAQQVLTEGLGADADPALVDHAIAGLPAALRAA
ncbi:MAG: F0F1 ATP synthase subunit B [Alphaproteobacteria bacterium]|nr:F0F1 ATP synthase subunit B [Alphaproteobacteria bacterium]